MYQGYKNKTQLYLPQAVLSQGRKNCVVVEEFVFYLCTLSLFLPPPQPPLNWTGLSRKEMRSFFDGADVTRLGDGSSFPEDKVEKEHVNISHVK